ncbi:hypothetical protein [Bacillus cereus]|uniref:Uncharacterized protein n=1 Tax=Bacillus cereus HuA3-9 TaxID=1053205 RepID=R8CIP3_BACCE|nr:hypothetical protein [Bacillus cereus]EOO11370.1 hypothetical protein IGA_05633 [Bacillus cereus HuA3-9]
MSTNDTMLKLIPHIAKHMSVIRHHQEWIKNNPDEKEEIKNRTKVINAEKEQIEMMDFLIRLRQSIEETNEEWNEKQA